jgi:hypothetical protein
MPNDSNVVRIAMWSGPRNISTALMRSWGNRSDTIVVDEPFYASYLKTTGKDHPGAEEIMAHGPTDWRGIVEQLTRSLPSSADQRDSRIFYQKQMTHHLLPEIDRAWLGLVTNCFLIRDPQEVITSYIKRNPDPLLEDLGFVQQAEIFDWVRQRSESIPPVIEAKEVLEDPERMLRLLCDAVGVEFDAAMMAWPAGPRESDGVWAKYWYDEAEKSTGFQTYRAKKETLPDRLYEIRDRCRECYERLYQYRLR